MKIRLVAPEGCEDTVRSVLRSLIPYGIGETPDRSPASELPAMEALSALTRIAACDVLVGLVTTKASGGWVELGYAVALGKPTVLIPLDAGGASVFAHLADEILTATEDSAVTPSDIAAACRRVHRTKARS